MSTDTRGGTGSDAPEGGARAHAPEGGAGSDAPEGGAGALAPEGAGALPGPPRAGPSARSPLRAVALPAEHGGWGLTAEPALLGLVVAPSVAGGSLAAAALAAFVARTPLKLALVDRWRGRRLPRTALAERVAAAELAAVAALVAVAFATASGAFWVPLAVAMPLLAVELWFDMRSRGRRLLPELAGSVGIASVAAAIVLAAGDSAAHGGGRLAVGLWLVVAARAVASLPFVRLQLARAKGRPARVAVSDAAQAAGLLLGAVAVVLDVRLVAGLVALALVAAIDVAGARRPPPPAVVLGVRQTVVGLAVVAATAAGVLA